MIEFSRRQNLIFDDPLPIKNSQGDSLQPRKLSADLKENLHICKCRGTD